MREEGKDISIAKMCEWSGVARSTFYYEPHLASPRPITLDEAVVLEIRKIIDEFPGYGVRRIHAVLRDRLEKAVNRKKVRRIIRVNGWQVRKKPVGSRPRAHGLRSIATRPNERWAIDTTHIFCGLDGWCYLTAIIDCCDRSIVGWRLSRRGIAKIAAAALEDAIRARGLKAPLASLCLRSDNGLVFGAKAFVKVVKGHGLDQEYITPYTPEQNGMIERWFRSLKEECVWLNRFSSKDDAFEAIGRWIDRYHNERPHQALGYLTPAQYAVKLVA